MLNQSLSPLALVLVVTLAAVLSLRGLQRRRTSLFSLAGWDPRLFSADLASRPQGDQTSIVLRELPGVAGLAACFRTVATSFGSGFGSIRTSLTRLLVPALAISLIAFCLIASPETAAAGGPDTVHVAQAAFAGSIATELKETEDAILGKSKNLHDVFEKAGDKVDFNNADVLKLVGAKDSAEVVEKVKAMNKELDELGKKADGLREIAKIEAKNHERLNAPTNEIPFPSRKGRTREGVQEELKTLGQVIMASDAVKNRKSQAQAETLVKDFGLHEIKTLFQTSAGWEPFSPRTNIVIDKATRPIQLLDIIPTGPTGAAAVPYMEETTRTDAAAERAEGGAYEEATYALTERTENVRSIGQSIPVTDEQLEDVQTAETYLNSRLSFGVRQRLDLQIMMGNGTPPNLQGIDGKTGVQTQALAGDPVPDAFFKAMTKVRVTGRAFPNAHVIHPTNWQTIRLLKTLDGIYIFGSPSEAGPDRLWGLQVVQFDGTAAGTGWTGDFVNFCQLYERRGLEVAVGYVGDQFKEGKRTIRAGVRVAFAIYRAAAFCKVTGL